MAGWIDHARIRAAKVAANLPADATLSQCRRAFREAGGAFHGGTYWGRKKWGQAVREILAQRGLIAAPSPAPVEASPKFADDIVFPWRRG